MSHNALKSHASKAVKGLDLACSDMQIPAICHGCETGKSHWKPFPSSDKKTSKILELVHPDLAGPMQTKSLQGSLYTATFIDDYSRQAVVYYLKTKDQFEMALQKFLAWAETQTKDKLCALRSDRSGKYIGD